MKTVEMLAKAKMKVDDTLQLLHEHAYVRLDYNNKKVFYYKQINPKIGVLIYYANAQNRFGNVNKHYDQHCFDLFIYSTTNVTIAVHQNLRHGVKNIDFYLPGFSPYNEKHLAVLDALDSETETDITILDEKYKILSGRNF